MPQRVEMPETAVRFIYRCAVEGCRFEDRYRDAVEDHERDHRRRQQEVPGTVTMTARAPYADVRVERRPDMPGIAAVSSDSRAGPTTQSG